MWTLYLWCLCIHHPTWILPASFNVSPLFTFPDIFHLSTGESVSCLICHPTDALLYPVISHKHVALLDNGPLDHQSTLHSVQPLSSPWTVLLNRRAEHGLY